QLDVAGGQFRGSFLYAALEAFVGRIQGARRSSQTDQSVCNAREQRDARQIEQDSVRIGPPQRAAITLVVGAQQVFGALRRGQAGQVLNQQIQLGLVLQDGPRVAYDGAKTVVASGVAGQNLQPRDDLIRKFAPGVEVEHEHVAAE